MNSISEIKSTIDGINNRLQETWEFFSDLENRLMESNQTEQGRDKKITLYNENRLRELSNSIKYNNICILWIPEGKERKKGAEVYLNK